MFRVPRVSVVRFWVIVRGAVIFAVMFAVAPAPLAMALDCQAVVLLPQVALPFRIQVPFVWAERFEIKTPAASASNTAIRIRRKEKTGGLEFIWGGMNGRQIRKRKRASTPQKPKIPRRTKIPSPPAEQVAKRRNRRAFDGEMRNHGDVGMRKIIQ